MKNTTKGRGELKKIKKEHLRAKFYPLVPYIMSWSYKILKEWNNYWIVEVFRKNKYKIYWYSSMLYIWKSKQFILNYLKGILKKDLNKWEMEEYIILQKNGFPLRKIDIRRIIQDTKKRKVLNSETIKKSIAKKR